MRRFTRLTIGVVLGMSALMLPRPATGTDIPIFPTGPVFALRGLAWGTSTVPGFNNNYFFTPNNLNESACVYVYNNNPTNAHSFTATITISADPTNVKPSDGSWQPVVNSTALSAPVSPGIAASFGAPISGTSQVSINFSGSSALGGVPDTATVFIVQTTADCFAGNSAIANRLNTTSASSPLQAISEGLSQGFAVTGTETNPGAATVIAHVWIPNRTRNLYYDHILVSTTAAAEFRVQLTSTSGTTCSNNSATNIRSSSFGASASSDFNCAVNPTAIANLGDAFLPANGQFVFDVRGAIADTVNGGIDVLVVGAVTGTLTCTVFWYEK